MRATTEYRLVAGRVSLAVTASPIEILDWVPQRYGVGDARTKLCVELQP